MPTDETPHFAPTLQSLPQAVAALLRRRLARRRPEGRPRVDPAQPSLTCDSAARHRRSAAKRSPLPPYRARWVCSSPVPTRETPVATSRAMMMPPRRSGRVPRSPEQMSQASKARPAAPQRGLQQADPPAVPYPCDCPRGQWYRHRSAWPDRQMQPAHLGTARVFDSRSAAERTLRGARQDRPEPLRRRPLCLRSCRLRLLSGHSCLAGRRHLCNCADRRWSVRLSGLRRPRSMRVHSNRHPRARMESLAPEARAPATMPRAGRRTHPTPRTDLRRAGSATAGAARWRLCRRRRSPRQAFRMTPMGRTWLCKPWATPPIEKIM